MRYAIIGNSAAGIAAARAIRSLDSEGEALIVSDESYPAYYRPIIPFFIDDRVGYQSLFRDEATMPTGVAVRLQARVRKIAPQSKSLTLETGETLPFDRLLIATGSSALTLSIPGLTGAGVYVLKTLADAQAIKGAAQMAKRVAVVGGGRVGMKAAMALRRRGLEVAVIEQGDRLVPLQLDEVAAEIVRRSVEAQGVRLFLNQTVREAETNRRRLEGLVLQDGRRLEADLLVLALGIRPNTELAGDAGLHVNRGVIVDEFLRTSASDVYAAGDVVQTTDILTGEPIVPATWTSAVEMGRVAGMNMAGKDQAYTGTVAILNSLVVAGIPTMSVGLIQPPDEDEYEVCVEKRGDSYRKLILKDDRLVGVLMVGEIEAAGLYTTLITRRIDLGPSSREIVTARRPGYARWLQHALSAAVSQTA